ncbi:hypothetical protein BDN72DRAFT_858832 [Pluteus cervinus]|uniref:Uncharacterized protein n=1 Tax=Pluteus cervinus TaxID=181527 RepID=A0ACD3ARB8_9AGAR|nr:hypothetical protein BDN72DRAFT_858832 [Pluteus cervinus]
MFSKSTFLLLATCASTAFGSNSVYYCTDINWGGDCHLSPPITGEDVCHNIEGGVGQFNDQISSFGPDSGLYCIIFNSDNVDRDYNCVFNTNGYMAGITSPGYADLRTIGFNDVISSYLCNIETGGPE